MLTMAVINQLFDTDTPEGQFALKIALTLRDAEQKMHAQGQRAKRRAIRAAGGNGVVTQRKKTRFALSPAIDEQIRIMNLAGYTARQTGEGLGVTAKQVYQSIHYARLMGRPTKPIRKYTHGVLLAERRKTMPVPGQCWEPRDSHHAKSVYRIVSVTTDAMGNTSVAMYGHHLTTMVLRTLHHDYTLVKEPG